jgi:hypothetical protein
VGCFNGGNRGRYVEDAASGPPHGIAFASTETTAAITQDQLYLWLPALDGEVTVGTANADTASFFSFKAAQASFKLPCRLSL